MGRVVKEAEHRAKRHEIIDAAMRLIYSKGYEQMTIQDILDTLEISRGAFCHYFDSKIAVLEASIERSAGEAERSLLQLINDPGLPAVQKLQGYFDWSTRWKTTQMEPVAKALRSWYSDENALIRQKTMAKSRQYMSRILEPIIRQGVAEGVFTTPHPAEVASIFAGITLSFSDSLVELVLTPSQGQESLRKSHRQLDVYFDTIERVLAAPTGSLRGIDVGVFMTSPIVDERAIPSKGVTP